MIQIKLENDLNNNMITKTNKQFNIGDYKQFSDTYIETGTAMGESIKRALLGGFKNIFSVDVHLPFVTAMRLKYEGRAEIHLGKSHDLLPLMLERANCNSVIFLDAHPAGENTGGHAELMQGNKEFQQDNILEAELKVTRDHMLSTVHRHIIILDDQDINSALKFAMQVTQFPILSGVPEYYYMDWKFSLWDEQLEDGIYRNDKILVCEPC